LSGRGASGLLNTPLTAFFASRQCPGAAIRAAMDWALQQARAKQVVVSGFHSPLEQSVLNNHQLKLVGLDYGLKVLIRVA